MSGIYYEGEEPVPAEEYERTQAIIRARKRSEASLPLAEQRNNAERKEALQLEEDGRQVRPDKPSEGMERLAKRYLPDVARIAALYRRYVMPEARNRFS